MKFILSMPPSINRTYGVNRNSRHPLFKKQIVRDWEDQAGWDILKQIKRRREDIKFPLLCPVRVGVVWFYDHNRDIEAGLKVLLDVFQKMNVYKNDRQVREIEHILIFEDKANPRVEVTIEPKL